MLTFPLFGSLKAKLYTPGVQKWRRMPLWGLESYRSRPTWPTESATPSIHILYSIT